MNHIQSHTEMSHILGLKTNPFVSGIIRPGLGNEGWYSVGASADSTQRRYKTLKAEPNQNTNELNDTNELNFLPISRDPVEAVLDRIDKLKENDYLGFSAYWINFSLSVHTVGMHILKQGETFHFIYVNKGERAAKTDVAAATVFSVKKEKVKPFVQEMLKAFKSKNRDKFSKFLDSKKDDINEALSKVIQKKEQKTGNCTTANANISWNLALMVDELNKNSSLSFKDAYMKARPTYKKLREKDQIEAFKYFLNEKNIYPSEKAFCYDLCQCLCKLTKKYGSSVTWGKILVSEVLSEKEKSTLKEALLSPAFFPAAVSFINSFGFVNSEYYKNFLVNGRKLFLDEISGAPTIPPVLENFEYERKTSQKPGVPGSEKKEQKINEILFMIDNLLSHIIKRERTNDESNNLTTKELKDRIFSEFTELCKLCCKERNPLSLFKNKYSSSTSSAQWLVTFLTDLLLHYNTEELLKVIIPHSIDSKIKLNDGEESVSNYADFAKLPLKEREDYLLALIQKTAGLPLQPRPEQAEQEINPGKRRPSEFF